jgi:succinate dehydrogenase / fumarate reductase, iron-sulfur subunit
VKYTFRILRFDPAEDLQPWFQEFALETAEHITVLEALMEIRNELDCTLSFRYSCREAVCGSCGMVINGKFDLACRTMLQSLGAPLVVIEPLPNLEILKDLVVDMRPFWHALESVEPYLQPADDRPEDGYRIEDRVMELIDPYTNCILCGLCYSACPVVSRDDRYVGAAALSKLYRFIKDPRDQRGYRRWVRVNTETGAWGCDTVFRCNEVCPRYVRPADGVEGLRRVLVGARIGRLFRKQV